jgi:hypothetical protein
MRTIGTVIVNPGRPKRRKRIAAGRKSAARGKAGRRALRRYKAAGTRTKARWAKPKKRKASKKRSSAKRRASSRPRNSKGQFIAKRRSVKAKAKSSFRKRRTGRKGKGGYRTGIKRVKGPKGGYRYKNAKGKFVSRSAAVRTRRNPWVKLNPKRIKILGNPMSASGLLGGLMSLALPGAVGGLALEAPIRLAPIVAAQDWIPEQLKGGIYFPLVSSAVGLIFAKYAHKVPVLGMVLKTAGVDPSKAAFAIAGAGFGVWYYKMRERQIANAAGVATLEQQTTGEDSVGAVTLGTMLLSGGYGAVTLPNPSMGAVSMDLGALGMGPAYSVGPQGFGAVMIGS